MDSDRCFDKVLIANRGEIALRVLRCLQDLGIESVIVFHDSDRYSPAVRLADEAVEITGDTPTAAYLDIAQIVEVARGTASDAVHPGYGFLAENAGFARSLEAAGICFIGPTADVIELMGDKIRSRDFVEQHGFPVPPSVSMNPDDPGFDTAVAAMGFPVVVKASAGGGGKGMSIVRSKEELARTVRVAASEAEKYFGDKRIYVERYFDCTRHIEVQILGDGERAVHLYERECSIQRRFQKIVEEAPSPALSDSVRAEICDVAVGIAAAANYSSAGTVEFLYTPEGEFYFLEMNTRIQVEHPVTEIVTGIDLIAEQIRIASGVPLRFKQEDIRLSGHAVECRICAENAYEGFTPETGRVLYLREPANTNVRFDSGLHQGQHITVAFDPMLAKLIGYGKTRDDAIAHTIDALQELVLLGVNTNINYLGKILKLPEFAEGETDTGFIPRHANQLVEDPPSTSQQQALLAAALLSDRGTRTILDTTPTPHRAIGRWRN